METFCDSCRQHLQNFVDLMRRGTENLLQKIKDFVQAIKSCCCLNQKKTWVNRLYRPVLQQHEKQAAQELLQHIAKVSEQKVIDRECLEVLETLAGSENPGLQQSAALYYLHISEQLNNELPEEYLEPLYALLQSNVLEVQRKASLSLVNLLVEGNVNKEAVVNLGLLEPILELLGSGDSTVQCNSCACIATLATSALNRDPIVSTGAVRPLLILAKSYDPRVQQNAVGAILNLTKSENNQVSLCNEGALPILILLLQSPDSEVQYQSCAALTNIASRPHHHLAMLQVVDGILLKLLLSLMSSSVEKVCCQACLCLRNLALNSKTDTKADIVSINYLPQLHELLRSSSETVNEAALSALSTLAENHSSREAIVSQHVLKTLGTLLLTHKMNLGIISYAATTIHHLVSIESQKAIVYSRCVSGLLYALTHLCVQDEPLLYVTACISELTRYEAVKTQIIQESDWNITTRLVMLCCQSGSAELCFHSASIINELALDEKMTLLLKPHIKNILTYISTFLKHQEVRFQQLGLLTISNLRKDSDFSAAFGEGRLQKQLSLVRQQTEETQELLRAALFHAAREAKKYNNQQ